MTANPNTRRAMVKGSAFTSIATNRRRSLARASLGIGIALGFALPAQAETVTLSCEGEMGSEGTTSPKNWTVDIDYTAQTVKWEVPGVLNSLEHPAVVTDREITFSYRTSNVSVEGRMDRLAGTMNATRQMFVPQERIFFQGRCRQAAKPKW